MVRGRDRGAWWGIPSYVSGSIQGVRFSGLAELSGRGFFYPEHALEDRRHACEHDAVDVEYVQRPHDGCVGEQVVFAVPLGGISSFEAWEGEVRGSYCIKRFTMEVSPLDPFISPVDAIVYDDNCTWERYEFVYVGKKMQGRLATITTDFRNRGRRNALLIYVFLAMSL